MVQQFFYDQQIRRFLLQFTRLMSNYQVEYGRNDDGSAALTRVPIRYGDASRQAATIIAENSRSKLPNTPMMTFYITGLNYARDRVQEPTFVSKKSFKQRSFNEESQSFENTQGNAFTVERLMPIPYNLSVNLDIWTSSTQQKLQLLEQILTLFNPSLEVQSTDNYLDWASLSVIELTNVNYSSRSVPQGTEETIDFATLSFDMPIWISPPARVTKLGVVTKIINSMFNSTGDLNDALNDDDLLMGTRLKVTPLEYQVVLIGNKLQVLRVNEVDPTRGTLDASTTVSGTDQQNWHSVVDMYGKLREGISQIRLSSDLFDTEVVGTVAYDPSDDRFLLFTVDTDTIPQNTIPAINKVIDPTVSGPGVNNLPEVADGQRYLLTDDIGASSGEVSSAWGSTAVAKKNDIIQYEGNAWQTVWKADEHELDDSSGVTDFVTNLTTGIQYKWTGSKWVKSYQGVYPGGDWSLVL